MKEPFFSKSPHEAGSHRNSNNNLKDYTYFDTVTRKYLEKKKRNETKREQNEERKQKNQLEYCTFRPILTSQHYYQNIRRTLNPKDPKKEEGNSKKEYAHTRLLNWNNRREIDRRNKIIEKQVTQMAIRQSLSVHKSRDKQYSRRKKPQARLNQSLEETLRSQESSEQHYRSINIIPLIGREQMEGERGGGSYRTIQSSKRGK